MHYYMLYIDYNMDLRSIFDRFYEIVKNEYPDFWQHTIFTHNLDLKVNVNDEDITLHFTYQSHHYTPPLGMKIKKKYYLHSVNYDEMRAIVRSFIINDCGYYDKAVHYSFTEPVMKQYTIIPYSRQIKQVIYNDPATIVFWKDGTKTVVKCQGNDKYSYASGLMHAIIRKIYGEDSRKYSDILDFITTAEEFDKMMEENSEGD